MRLAKLSLFGFKSFADRTEIGFEQGITAIVGPNGCGKSNIADAIRWALGEQSARQLRGERMDDVIFAGNAKRKPLGFAEVSLTLTEANGHLPTPYEDIGVCRRLFRSGESEYLLNKAQCRLRDIHDLFLDTGLGGEPYALIEQGNVGAVINARPLERRIYIEEAAGIMKYKVKKRLALNKLDAASQNLTRIQDIIREIERQRGSLKRQAAKAERYRALETRAGELRLALKWAERRALVAQLAAIAAEEAPLREALEALQVRLAAREADLQALRLRALEEERNLGEAQEALFLLRNRLEKGEGDLRTAEQELTDLARREHEGVERAAALAGRIQDSEAVARKAADRLAALLAEAEAHDTALADLLAAGETLVTAYGAAAAAAAAARSGVFRAAADLGAARTRLAALEERRRGLAAQAAKMSEQVAGVRQERSVADAGIEDQAARRAALAGRRAGFEVDLAGARDCVVAGGREVVDAAARVAGARETLEHLRARQTSLAELEQAREGYDAGHRYLLESREEDPDLAPILGPLTDALDPARGCERAIEALLGARLQALRVADLEAAGPILGRLDAGERGRATLVADRLPWNGGGWTHAPFPALRGHLAAIPADVRARVRGAAVDLVAANGATPALYRLLDDGIVVEDLAAALALAPHLPGPFAIATLRGELLDHRGTVTGGSAAAGILVRRREARDLPALVQGAEACLAVAEDDHAARQADLRGAGEAVARLDDALRALDLEALGVEKDLERHRSVASRLGQQLDLFGYELEELEGETHRLEAELGALQADIATGQAAAAAAEACAAAAQAEVERLQGARDAHAAQVTERRVALSQARARTETEERTVAAARQEATQLSEERSLAEAAVAAARVRQGELRDRTAALRVELQAVATEERARDESLAGAREMRAASQAREAALEQDLRDARAAEGEQSRALNGLDVKRAEIGKGLDLLDAALAEEHGLAAADLEALDPERIPADPEAARAELEDVRRRMAEMGAVNMAALEEYAALEQRYEFLTKQTDDLVRSTESLKATISEINKTIGSRFAETLAAVNIHFDTYWKRLFGGGSAELKLVPVEGYEEEGVEMMLRIPGKRAVTLTLLSGGERALGALALLLALFAVRPSPFCVMDEVDAPLDDANVERFVKLLREMATTTQILLVTHNKRTMEAADVLYGVTMEEEGASKLMAVRLADVPDAVAA